MRRAWEDGLRPTGVLAMSDAMAIGVLRAARELGLRVPEDVSVVGFDDIDICQHTNPPLTTVHQPIRRKGESAVRLLLSVVERRDLRPEQHPARDAAHRPRLDRAGAAPAAGGEPGAETEVQGRRPSREFARRGNVLDHSPVAPTHGSQGRPGPQPRPAPPVGNSGPIRFVWRSTRPG